MLDKFERVIPDPFPHILIENALDDDYYEELAASRPTPEEIINGRKVSDNQRIDMPCRDVCERGHPLWKEFCLYHSSEEFFRRVIGLFSVKAEYPGRRNAGRTGAECQIGINTPSPKLSRVRGPHLDNPNELYGGLFYMADDNDGGNLEIYRWVKAPRFYGKLEAHDDCVELAGTIPYKKNTFVMFLNGPDSLHGVTPRKSDNYRKLVNVICDMPEPVFRVNRAD